MIKKWMFFLSTLFLSLALVACQGGEEGSSNESTGSDTLVVADWGGAFTEAKEQTYADFEEEYGVEIIVDTPSNVAQLRAMVDSDDVQWDVVNLEGMISLQLGEAGYLEELDYDIINTDGLTEEAIDIYSVVHNFYTLVVGYNTDTIATGDHPTSFSEYFDVDEFPEDRVMSRRPTGILEIALLADGVEPEELYPLDVDRAFSKLDEIQDHVTVWADSLGITITSLSQNDPPLGITASGRVFSAQEEGAQVEYDTNQGIIMDDRLMVPKGAPNKDLAMEFINFSLQPEQQMGFLSNYPSEPANKEVFDLLSEEEIEDMRQDPESVQDHIYVDNEWWAENFEEVNERLTEWLIQ